MFYSARSSPLYLVFLVAMVIGGYFFRGHSTNASLDTLTKKNYDLIKTGMDQDEVDDILTGINEPMSGPGKVMISGSKIESDRDTFDLNLVDGEVKWEYGPKSITIGFKDRKVAKKSQSGLK